MNQKGERAAWGARIRSERLQLGMTQDELAEAAKVSRRTIGSIERGDVVAQPGVLARILKALGLEPEPPRFDEETETLLAIVGPLIAAIPPQRRNEVMRRVIPILTASIRGE